MKNNEYNKFVDLIKKLSSNFKPKPDKEKIDFYFYELKKYKLNAVERGINYLIHTRVYPTFPIVGEITEAIKNTRHRRII